MAARRAQQAKQSLASNSNLSTLPSGATLQANNTRARLKSTSMTNLVGNTTPNSNSTSNNTSSRIQRPASRNALDNIHKGMNAKFTHVQSKVLLQNIRPQQQQQQQQAKSKIPAKPERLTPTTPSSTLRRSTPQPSGSGAASGKIQLSDRSQLINKIKSLQEELERYERQNDELKQELERERADKTELVQQAKFELQERVAESERQSEEYHQKLLEAYELADQNRRAADSVLSESRQREEELRKKIDELEQQLGELREFVSMKEEMLGKMGEMREQIRAERERYEEKTRSLHQMFENEKLSNSGQMRSNYFRRTKPSLQSAESINKLDDGPGGQQERPHYHNQSEHDIYGSKLSTRMQDGARLAWKKSRKFASSVITGSLGGISACRRHNSNNSKSNGSSSNNNNTASSSSGHHNQVVTVMHANGAELVGAVAANQQQHHTSVIEVGSTVGEFIAHQQQPSETLATIHHHQQQQTTNQPTVYSESCSNNLQQQQQQQGLIRVDENNKLTIVTKFSEQTPTNGQQQSGQKPDTPELGSASSPSSEHSCSERSRCESSSSGLGTAASDSGNSCPGSHNGDHPEQPLDMQQQRDGVIKTAMNGADARDTSLEAHHQRKPEPHQRHKRKSSLFKSSAFSGSQASLNKTFKSFFALASSKAGSLALSSANKCPAEEDGAPSSVSSTLTAAKHDHGYNGCATPATLVNQTSSSPEVFVVEPVGSGREQQQPSAGPASTPTSSLKSSSLTDSDRTITGELSSSSGGNGPTTNESGQPSKPSIAANTTTTMILNEFVRYEERPNGDENATNNNNESLRASSDDETDANELVRTKLGQGEHRADEDKSAAARFEHHHHHHQQQQHRAEVAVEH